LELCKVLAIWEVPLQAILGAAIVGKILGDVFNIELPLLLQVVALLEAGADLSFVFLVVRGNLALALLIDLNFQATLSWPLLSEVLIELVNTLITEVLNLLLDLFGILSLRLEEPVDTAVTGLSEYPNDLGLQDHQLLVKAIDTLRVLRGLHVGLGQVVVFLEFRSWRSLVSSLRCQRGAIN
jgi:hypothetical protein